MLGIRSVYQLIVSKAHTAKVGTLIAIGLGAVLMLGLAIRVDPLWPDHPNFSRQWDHHAYIAMAEAPHDTHPTPFCYRLLVPTIARQLPFELPISFYILTWFFLLGTGLVIYHLLRAMGEGPWYSLAGVAFFYSLNWGAKFTLWDFWRVDPALFFFSTLSFYFIIQRKQVLLVVALSLAVLSKEAALFLIPFYYIYRARRIIDIKAIIQTLIVGVLPVFIFVLVRWMVPGEGDYDVLSLFGKIGIPRLTTGLSGFIRAGTAGTWGIVLFVLPFFALRDHRRFALAGAVFLLFVYAQPLFAINVDRLLVFGFPVVIPLAVTGLRNLSGRFGLSTWMTAGYTLVPYFLIMSKSGFQTPSVEKRLLAVAIWTAIVFAVKARDRKNQP